MNATAQVERSKGRVPSDWTVLHGEDGYAIVVPPGTSPDEAFIELLAAHHGVGAAPDHPAVVAACEGLKVEVWRSCTAAWAEAEGVDIEGMNGWWAPHGDGKRWIHVLCFEGDLYGIGDSIEQSCELPA